MNIFWSILSICSAAQATIEIHNTSAYPFRIISTTYEHNDGLQKTPFIELTPLIVKPQGHLQLSGIRREPIRNITGVHANRTYTFDLPANLQGIISVTPDNQVRLLSTQSMKINQELNLSSKEKQRGIRRL